MQQVAGEKTFSCTRPDSPNVYLSGGGDLDSLQSSALIEPHSLFPLSTLSSSHQHLRSNFFPCAMSFHLTPMYHNNWSPLGSFNTDLRRMKNLLHCDGSSRSGTPTVEPSYSFESNDKEASFEIEMPGVSKENISIEANGQKLIVKGQRFKKGGNMMDTENGTENKNDQVTETKDSGPKPSLVYLLEARLGSTADIDGIKADNCGDGILFVHVPMKVEKGSRKIEIGL